MPSKFEEFLTAKKIDRRQLVTVSKDVEGLRPEDRAIKLAKRRGKVEGASEADKKETRKVRSGRAINPVMLAKVLAGKPVTGPTKNRVLRAVNALLAKKKQAEVQLADLFDPALGSAKKKKVEKTDKKRK
jgi:hypothetical protein